MIEPEATPKDSRYVPFTQQPSCCVPTSMLMVMYKNGIPLIPAEELGYHLGLTVHPDRAKLFYKARASEIPPPAGYGTQIYFPEYEPNTVFKKVGIPLKFEEKHISGISSSEELVKLLSEVEQKNGDALLCFNHGALVDDPERDWGHIVVFDRVVDGKLRIVDASPDYPKWRLVKSEKMYEAMVIHGQRKSAAGIWLFTKTA